jgi:hypothetical protein
MVLTSGPGATPVLDVADEPVGPLADGAGALRPITTGDVEAIRRDLAAWDGDLVGWLDRLEREAPRGSVADR